MSEKPKVPVIRNDAQVRIVLGTGFIKQLQDVSLYMLMSRPEDEIDAFSKELQSEKLEFEDSWKTHYITIAALLRAIDVAAKEQNFVDEVTQDDYISQQDSL